MGTLDRFEKGVERVFNGAFAKLFRGELKPVQLAAGLRKEADLKAVPLDRSRTVAPNVYTITLSEHDFDAIAAWGLQALADELADHITQHAAEQRYSFVGPVSVSLVADDSVSHGLFEVTSATVRGNVAPSTTQAGTQRHPVLDIDGERYLLTGPVTVIGRGSESDIVVDDPGVSRAHLEIRITPQGVIAKDLNSTNGLYVEGHQVPSATLLDGNTLTIGRTRIQYWAADPLEGEDA